MKVQGPETTITEKWEMWFSSGWVMFYLFWKWKGESGRLVFHELSLTKTSERWRVLFLSCLMAGYSAPPISNQTKCRFSTTKRVNSYPHSALAGVSLLNKAPTSRLFKHHGIFMPPLSWFHDNNQSCLVTCHGAISPCRPKTFCRDRDVLSLTSSKNTQFVSWSLHILGLFLYR